MNKRTIGYTKQDPGEQAKDPLVQAELKQLSDRQKVLRTCSTRSRRRRTSEPCSEPVGFERRLQTGNRLELRG